MVDQTRNNSIKIGMELEGLVKKSLEEFLKANTDVMAYNITEMPEVDSNIIVHHYNVKKDYKQVKYNKHFFVPYRKEAI